MSDLAAVVGAVLAGGRARRIGGSKASSELGGRPLIEYPLAALERAGIARAVVAKRASPLPSLAVPIWREPDEPVHPLAGVLAALRRSCGRPVVAVGCDMPFVTPAMLERLAEIDAPLAVPVSEDRLEPLLARYEPSLIADIDRALERRAPMREAIAGLRPRLIAGRELEALGVPERLFFNVNTPHDLQVAERMLRTSY